MVSKENKPRTIIVNWQPPSEANGKITGESRSLQHTAEQDTGENLRKTYELSEYLWRATYNSNSTNFDAVHLLCGFFFFLLPRSFRLHFFQQ